jgi:hypothetical protein
MLKSCQEKQNALKGFMTGVKVVFDLSYEALMNDQENEILAK